MMKVKIRITTGGGAVPSPGCDGTREPLRNRLVSLWVQSGRNWPLTGVSRFNVTWA
jgi:hypothetical protein